MSENNLLSYTGNGPAGTLELGDVLATTANSDALHFSAALIYSVHATSIVGGHEDCVDVNNVSETINVSCDKFYSGGLFVATIKGGSRQIMISGTIYTHGSEVDIDLGNWSDQSSDLTRDVSLNLHTVDGSPVTYRVLNAELPHLTPGSGPYKAKFILPRFLIGPVWFFWGILKKLGLA